MKHYFILNPVSGSSRQLHKLIEEIDRTTRKLNTDYEIYETKSPGDGRRFVKQVCENAEAQTGEKKKIRIYGCGGDGTVHEIVNGAFGYENVEIGVIPQGTGNDYIRNYGKPDDFLNIENQIKGTSVFSDLIKYRGEYNGEITSGFCANMFNIGFDCNVVDMTDKLKKLPLLAGPVAYLVSVFVVLAGKKETCMELKYSDGSTWSGSALLLAIGNGCYCGGGIKGIPKADLQDGLMDIGLIKGGITRNFFVRMFPKYKKGTHLSVKKLEKFIDYRQDRTLTVTSADGNLKICVDGEISPQNKMEFTLLPRAFRFIVPDGISI